MVVKIQILCMKLCVTSARPMRFTKKMAKTLTRMLVSQKKWASSIEFPVHLIAIEEF
jgi:hypothetical protein